MGSPEARVLLVGAREEDTAWVRSIQQPTLWELETSTSVASALAEIDLEKVAVLLCDGDGDPDAWRTMLVACHHLAHPPCVIVASRLADDRLWAEALNLGAYDVLAKPFDSREVLHALNRASLDWLTPAPMPSQAALHNHARTAAA